MIGWDDIDTRLEVARVFTLTDLELHEVRAADQAAYESNLPRIRELLEEHEIELKRREFWTELQADTTGLRFRYSTPGLYGPGGSRPITTLWDLS